MNSLQEILPWKQKKLKFFRWRVISQKKFLSGNSAPLSFTQVNKTFLKKVLQSKYIWTRLLIFFIDKLYKSSILLWYSLLSPGMICFCLTTHVSDALKCLPWYDKHNIRDNHYVYMKLQVRNAVKDLPRFDFQNSS